MGKKRKDMLFTARIPAARIDEFEKARAADGRTKMGYALRAIEEKLARDAAASNVRHP